MEYYSGHITKLIDELSRLPGIGAKSAQRLAFHIINMPEEQVDRLASSMTEARRNIRYCKECTAGKKRKKSAPNTEYLKGHYDYIRVNVPKGEREKIKAYAESLGMSVNKLLLTALEEYKEHHS